MFFTKLTAFAVLALSAQQVLALEDPRTTTIKANLAKFCSSLNGAVGAKGANCFDISGAYASSILAAKKTDPCDRTVKAQAILDNFPNAAGVVALAQSMATAPINVLPPAALPGLEIACPTALVIGGASKASTSAPAPAPPASAPVSAPAAPPAKTASAPPAPASGKCVVDGSMTCSGTGFTVCAPSGPVTMQCAPGTACKASGRFINCL
ncbi:hypothetical protein HKX48_004070 [Thoreauomyces humboldtii]|nr:hypothetical protein HKX48_004070 [Thoreauomyces humboldtii]